MSVVTAIRNPRSYAAGVFRTYRLLLFNPSEFYERLDTRGMRKEILLVIVVGLIGTLGSYYAFQRVMSPFTVTTPLETGAGTPLQISNDIKIQLQFGRAIAPFLITVVVVWVLFSVGFYFGSWIFNSRGRFRHMLKNAAWGLVPFTGTMAISSLSYAYVAANLELSSNDPTLWYNEGGFPTGTAERLSAFIWEKVFAEPIVLGGTLVGLVFFVWCWYIWAHAIFDVRKIDLREAYLVAAVPPLVYILYTVWMVLGAANVL